MFFPCASPLWYQEQVAPSFTFVFVQPALPGSAFVFHAIIRERRFFQFQTLILRFICSPG